MSVRLLLLRGRSKSGKLLPMMRDSQIDTTGEELRPQVGIGIGGVRRPLVGICPQIPICVINTASPPAFSHILAAPKKLISCQKILQSPSDRWKNRRRLLEKTPSLRELYPVGALQRRSSFTKNRSPCGVRRRSYLYRRHLFR